MPRIDAEFKKRVYDVVAQIPKGRLMTYGEVAAASGAAWAAWEVGQIAHSAPCASLPACPGQAGQPADLTAHQPPFGSATPSTHLHTSQSVAHRKKSAAPSAKSGVCPKHDLPWQRVVNKNGGLARGYTSGGFEAHKRDLEKDGVEVSSEYTVDIEGLRWRPPHKDQSQLL